MITVQRGSRQSQGHHGEHNEGGDGQATDNGGSDDQILTGGLLRLQKGGEFEETPQPVRPARVPQDEHLI